MKNGRILGLASLAAMSASSLAVVSNFDSLTAGANAPNAIAGLTIVCGNATDVVNVGDVTTYTMDFNGFNVYADPNTAWSGDNVAFCPGTKDILMTFDVAVTSASVLSDRYANDGNDVIRLVALKALGNDQYEVLDIDNTTDGFTDGIGNFMSVAYAPGFSHLMFITTTEQEGFDDLTYEAVPEPATLVVLAGLAALARRRKA